MRHEQIAYSQYGASMGRREHEATAPATTAKPKFALVRVRLDRGGYDKGGAYWGVGSPLYEYQSDDYGDDTVSGFIRAYDRDDAKAKVRAKYPNASFYR